VLAASVAQCAAVTILSGATRVAPQYWPLGTGDPLLFSASAHGVSAVCAISPPTIRVCGGSGAGAADAVATAPSDAAVSAAAARPARTSWSFPVIASRSTGERDRAGVAAYRAASTAYGA
jgi:hypothetical protein